MKMTPHKHHTSHISDRFVRYTQCSGDTFEGESTAVVSYPVHSGSGTIVMAGQT